MEYFKFEIMKYTSFFIFPYHEELLTHFLIESQCIEDTNVVSLQRIILRIKFKKYVLNYICSK